MQDIKIYQYINGSNIIYSCRPISITVKTRAERNAANLSSGRGEAGRFMFLLFTYARPA